MANTSVVGPGGIEVNLEESPVPLNEVGDRLYLDNHFGIAPESGLIALAGSSSFVLDRGKPFAQITYHSDATWHDRGQTWGLLLGVNSDGLTRLTRYVEHPPLVINVLNISVEELPDPTMISSQIRPGDTLYTAAQSDATLLGSWVIDSIVRDRVNEWATTNRQITEKWVALRNAPHIPNHGMSVARDTGNFSYVNVRDEAEGQLPTVWDPLQAKSVPGRPSHYAFMPEDLEWLNAYMNTLGKPIPKV